MKDGDMETAHNSVITMKSHLLKRCVRLDLT